MAFAWRTASSLDGQRHAEGIASARAETRPVAQLGRLLELKVLRGIEHRLLELLQLLLHSLIAHSVVIALRLGRLHMLFAFVGVVHAVDEILDALFCTPIGVMPIFSFQAICLLRRRSVSPIAFCIESVILSP